MKYFKIVKDTNSDYHLLVLGKYIVHKGTHDECLSYLNDNKLDLILEIFTLAYTLLEEHKETLNHNYNDNE